MSSCAPTGTSLYLTKDLALARVKFEEFHVDRSIYVVDVRQSLHLQQAFAILRLMGFPQAEKCYHLGYGFVSLPEGAMSARKGQVVLFKDVADEAIRRVMVEIEQKNPELPEDLRQTVARQVGLGALAYAMLSIDNNKGMIFDVQAALNFELGHHSADIDMPRQLQSEGRRMSLPSQLYYPLTSDPIDRSRLRFPRPPRARPARHRGDVGDELQRRLPPES